MKCFYHIDLDGECSAAIVLSKFPYCETISIDYSKDPYPYLDSISSGELIFIVDFSFKPDFMSLLCQKVDVVWIDHHKTILDHPFNRSDIKGIRDTSKSGCELTWEYVYPNLDKMQDTPLAVSLIGDYDTWKFKMKNSKFFHYGISIHDTSPNSDLWKTLLTYQDPEGVISDIVKEGIPIQTFIEKVAKSKRDSYGFETTLDGHPAFALNYYAFGSNIFQETQNRYDLCISFLFDGTQWIVGLYSTKIDVSEIAKKFGGGGHRGAAGFVCKELPFKKII